MQVLDAARPTVALERARVFLPVVARPALDRFTPGPQQRLPLALPRELTASQRRTLGELQAPTARTFEERLLNLEDGAEAYRAENEHHGRFLADTAGLLTGEQAEIVQNRHDERLEDSGYGESVEEFLAMARDPEFLEGFDQLDEGARRRFFERFPDLEHSPEGRKFLDDFYQNLAEGGDDPLSQAARDLRPEALTEVGLARALEGPEALERFFQVQEEVLGEAVPAEVKGALRDLQGARGTQQFERARGRVAGLLAKGSPAWLGGLALPLEALKVAEEGLQVADPGLLLRSAGNAASVASYAARILSVGGVARGLGTAGSALFALGAAIGAVKNFQEGDWKDGSGDLLQAVGAGMTPWFPIAGLAVWGAGVLVKVDWEGDPYARHFGAEMRAIGNPVDFFPRAIQSLTPEAREAAAEQAGRLGLTPLEFLRGYATDDDLASHRVLQDVESGLLDDPLPHTGDPAGLEDFIDRGAHLLGRDSAELEQELVEQAQERYADYLRTNPEIPVDFARFFENVVGDLMIERI